MLYAVCTAVMLVLGQCMKVNECIYVQASRWVQSMWVCAMYVSFCIVCEFVQCMWVCAMYVGLCIVCEFVQCV